VLFKKFDGNLVSKLLNLKKLNEQMMDKEKKNDSMKATLIAMRIC